MSKGSGSSSTDVETYVSQDGEVRLDIPVDKDTVWLSQAKLVKLFGRSVSVISWHIANVFREKELDRKSNSQNLRIASSDRPVTFYSLDVMISVGYRVKSPRGTQFRIWATRVLRDHLVKGYTLNQQRLGQTGLADLAGRALQANKLVSDERRGVLDVVSDYARTERRAYVGRGRHARLATRCGSQLA